MRTLLIATAFVALAGSATAFETKGSIEESFYMPELDTSKGLRGFVSLDTVRYLNTGALPFDENGRPWNGGTGYCPTGREAKKEVEDRLRAV